MLKNFIFAASAGFLILVSGTMASSKPNYQVAQGNVNTAAIEASVFQKINQYRDSQNLPRLNRNSTIDNRHKDPATQAVQGWLKSSGHLANIRGNYTLTGIGVASNNQGEIYFTQIFLQSR